MSTLPALLEGTAIQEQVRSLHAIRLWVRGVGAYEASETATKAKQVRSYLKAINGAAAIALEATRLECDALRRLGQIGAADKAGSPEMVNIARQFASMSDAEFDALLVDLKPWASAVSIVRAMRRAEREQEERNWGQSVGSGTPGSPVPPQHSISSLAEAAGALLADLTTDGKPFTIAEAAEKLAEHVCDNYTSPAARAGYIEAVRLSIQAENGDHGWASCGGPQWITYQEDEVGWVRIHWSAATLDQFRAMVDLRRHQLAELRNRVEDLESILAFMDEAHVAHPDLTRCVDLDRVAAGHPHPMAGAA